MAKLPISTFLTDRLTEFDSKFELRSGTGFESLFFKPIEFIVQPLRDEANDIFVGQSFLRILLTDNPDSFDELAVDALASNLFVTRRQGGKSSGTARVYYNNAVDREYPAGGAVFTGSNGLVYTNPSPFIITATQMGLQLEDGFFYFDIPVESDDSGENTELEIDNLVSIANDDEVVRVTNKSPIEGGLDRELNTDFITRVQNSIGVRDLVTGKGFNAILFENFLNTLAEVQPIGFGDAEMMRDIVYNVHIGGRVDGWSKTSRIRQGSKSVVGLLIDETRQTFTTTNVQLDGVNWANVGNPNIDRSNGLAPIVQEIKLSTTAEYISPVDLSSPIDLSVNQHVKIGIDGVFKNIRVAGVTPAATTRNEIVNLINAVFGVNVAFPVLDSFKLKSLTSGLTSQIAIDNPDIGNSALFEVFGLSPGSAPYTFDGDGPVTFSEGVHYDIDDGLGNIRRIIGALVLVLQINGETTMDSDIFTDPTTNVFLNVQERDVITISTGSDIGDYRVAEKIDNNTLRLDKELTTTDTGIEYEIRRTGIKDDEFVYVQYYFNPLSIDVGNLIKLDEFGAVRGIRPGRELQTITDLAFLRIISIEEIDPLTLEPTGFVLDGKAGYGQGGYGEGAYGIGDGGDYRLVVNSPSERFSMFEDSYIVIRSGLAGLSFRVNYDYVPEISDYHTFVRSETERVLDGDILMKHFIPAYVSGLIQYKVDSTNASIPDNDTLTASLKDFVNKTKSGQPLEYSDIIQFIARMTDPFDQYGTFVKIFSLEASIHNTDGTVTVVTGKDKLEIPTLDPFPRFTIRPISPRTAHWVADEIVLERIS